MHFGQTRNMLILLTMGLIATACGTSQADEPTTTAAPGAVEASTTTTTMPATTTTVPVSTTIDQAAIAKKVDIVERFMTARQDRNLEQALSYLDESVFMDWGPGTTYETLEAGLAWEDAFGIEFTLQYCEHDPYALTEEPIVCSLGVQTVVNEINSAGNGNPDGESDTVCVLVTVDELITKAELTSGAGCEFSFWEYG